MTSTARAPVDVDVAIVGSGFAGTLAALALRRRGRRVALLERGRHPRFAIGESTTPLANLLLETLADRYDLPRIRAFAKWGPWQREHAAVAVGLKRGFSFFFHRPGEPFSDGQDHARQLLVAASPRDEIADTHWYRQAFDLALVREAQAAGVIYLDDTQLDDVRDGGSRLSLVGTRRGQAVNVTADFVIDASGPRGFLATRLGLDAGPLRWMPPTQGLYTHFEEVALWETVAPPGAAPPYPPDAAALHHVFPGGWIWALRFNNGLVSAGAALTDGLAAEVAAEDGAPTWDRLIARLPSVREQFAAARAARPFVHVPRLAWRCRDVAGERWALLPSAAGFVDPLLSTGFALTLLGVLRLLDVLETTEAGEARRLALAEYAAATQAELDAAEQLVAALYATMADAGLFKRLALLYFAAASFSEAAYRLGRPQLAPGFLLCRHPTFAPELRACAQLALRAPTGDDRAALIDRIDRAIAPFDTAGLRDRSRRDWYPVLASDLLANASKLEASAEEIRGMLERCGLK